MKKLFLIIAVFFSLGTAGLFAQEEAAANQSEQTPAENSSKKIFFFKH